MDEKGDKELQVVKVEVDNVVHELMVLEEDTPEKKPSAGSIDEVYESFPSSQVRGEEFIKMIETQNKEVTEDKKYSVTTEDISDCEQEKKEKEITNKDDLDTTHDKKEKEITNKENKDKENNEEESGKKKESKSTAKADSENEEQSDKRKQESLEEDTKDIRKIDTDSNKPKNDDDDSAELVFIERYVDLYIVFF